MSRNLEILEQVQQDRELFRVLPVANRTAGRGKPSQASTPAVGADGFAHEELIGLAQRLFLFLAADKDGSSRMRQVVFCGVDEADGASALCASLGRILVSQGASPVCVVDANVRAPVLQRLLGAEPSAGQGSDQAAAEPQLLEKIEDNLWLISGHLAAANGGVTASLNQVRSQMKELPAAFAYVVINAPPVVLYNDAVLLGQGADGSTLGTDDEPAHHPPCPPLFQRSGDLRRVRSWP